jgi:hypothetical protein
MIRFAHGGLKTVSEWVTQAREYIKKVSIGVLYRVRGVRFEQRSGHFAHGFALSVCKMRIAVFGLCNSAQLHQDRVRHFVEVSPNHDIYISIPGCGRTDHAEAPPRNKGSASLQGEVSNHS